MGNVLFTEIDILNTYFECQIFDSLDTNILFKQAKSGVLNP